jgi:hypothetical protein
MLEFDSLLIQAKVLNATVTPISLVTGTRVMQHMTRAQPSQGVVGSFSMLDVL